MPIKRLSDGYSVSGQLDTADLDAAAKAGFRSIINNRPDGEEPGQPANANLEAHATALGLHYYALPIVSGKGGQADARRLGEILAGAPKPVLAFCRTGNRSTNLWTWAQSYPAADHGHGADADIVIVGGGAGGIAAAASLIRRRPDLDIAIIEPRDEHFYQPGWTMVGGGIFSADATRRPEKTLIPRGVRRINGAVATFEPRENRVTLADGQRLGYRLLIVAAGIMLDWGAIDGLEASLGTNGVTSNYRFDTAPYTWQQVRALREGVALFTQPPMPIKCAGAPQKAMYLSCDHWRREGRLGNIEVAFHNAGTTLFGIKEYVPELMSYVDRYGIDLRFESRLVAIDGPSRRATFAEESGEITRDFGMIHVTPPQRAPAFIAASPLADAAGYVGADSATLRHPEYPNVFSLGDVAGTSNAKTAAAARKQAPIVAVNALAVLDGGEPVATYDGYGSCPLTVERGRIVLAEFGYGGKLLPTFPSWLIDGQRAQRLPWALKARALPWIYWNGMLKGREWLVSPRIDPARGTA